MRSRHELSVVAAVVAAMAGLLVADLLTAQRVVLTGLFGVGPVVAAAMVRVRLTAALAVVGSLLAAFSGLWYHDYGSAGFGVRMTLVAVLSVAAVVNASVRTRREAQLARVTTVADVVQRAVLPPLPAELGRLRFGCRYLSAASDALVGGDFFDVVARPGGARLLIGDVRGKGLAAVEQSARAVRLFRQAVVHPQLPDVAREVDEQLAGWLGPEDFVTALFVELRPAADVVTVVNCGHHPPLLVDGDRWRLLDDLPARPPLGVSLDGQVPVPLAGRRPWPATARLLLYTDGLVEGRDRAGRFLPLSTVAAAAAGGEPQAAVDRVVATLLEHVGGTPADDLAVVVVDRAASIPAAVSAAGPPRPPAAP